MQKKQQTRGMGIGVGVSDPNKNEPYLFHTPLETVSWSSFFFLGTMIQDKIWKNGESGGNEREREREKSLGERVKTKVASVGTKWRRMEEQDELQGLNLPPHLAHGPTWMKALGPLTGRVA